jgi:hypothetical protein
VALLISWKGVPPLVKSPNRSDDGSTQVSNCTAYYLVLTYYENGVIVNQTETYLGMKCDEGQPCSPEYESLCSVEDGGGLPLKIKIICFEIDYSVLSYP